MRAGYLTVLAARALGVAPVLRPATPARFEPEAPQAGFREIAEVLEAAAAGLPLAPAQGRARAEATMADPVWDDDRPLLGFIAPDRADERPEVRLAQHGQLVPGPFGPAAEPAERAGPSRRSGWAGAGTATGFPASTPTGAEALDPAATWPPDTFGALRPPAAPGEAASAAPSPGGQATWPDDVVHTRRSRPEAQQAGQAGEPAGTRGPEPPIVVRIGRVDVRAVQATPPAPAPRPRPTAGPSLAEHLLARDRGRR